MLITTLLFINQNYYNNPILRESYRDSTENYKP